MTASATWQDAVKSARAALEAGDIATATQFTEEAKALKALAALESSETLERPAYPAAKTDADPAPGDIAIKAWYTKQYGATLDADAKLILNDLYGKDYEYLRWAKMADFSRYVRTGVADPKLHRAVVYTPEQVMSALADGMSLQAIKATQVESQDVLGGFLVPEDFRDAVVQRIAGLTAMRNVAEVITTMSDRVTMPVGTGGDDRYVGNTRVYKVDESPSGTEAATNATFGSVTIPVHTLMAHTPISKNLLEDTTGARSILGILQGEMGAAYAIFEDEQFLIGNGVGGPLGVLLNATTGGPNTYQYGSVQTVNTGAATALTGDAFRNTPYAIASQYRSNGGLWVMSRGTVRATKLLKAGDGTYLWSGRGDTPQLAQGQPQSLEGYPIRESEALASPTATNNTTYTANVWPVLFLTKGAYMIVDKAGAADIQRYDDSTTAKTNSVVVVMRRRVGGQLIRPWGAAAMKISA